MAGGKKAAHAQRPVCADGGISTRKLLCWANPFGGGESGRIETAVLGLCRTFCSRRLPPPGPQYAPISLRNSQVHRGGRPTTRQALKAMAAYRAAQTAPLGGRCCPADFPRATRGPRVWCAPSFFFVVTRTGITTGALPPRTVSQCCKACPGIRAMGMRRLSKGSRYSARANCIQFRKWF